MGLIVTDGEMMMICSSGVQESPATPIKRVPGVPDGVGTSLPCKKTSSIGENSVPKRVLAFLSTFLNMFVHSKINFFWEMLF